MGVVTLTDWVSNSNEKDIAAEESHTHFDQIGGQHEFKHCSVHAAEADVPNEQCSV